MTAEKIYPTSLTDHRLSGNTLTPDLFTASSPRSNEYSMQIGESFQFFPVQQGLSTDGKNVNDHAFQKLSVSHNLLTTFRDLAENTQMGGMLMTQEKWGEKDLAVHFLATHDVLALHVFTDPNDSETISAITYTPFQDTRIHPHAAFSGRTVSEGRIPLREGERVILLRLDRIEDGIPTPRRLQESDIEAIEDALMDFPRLDMPLMIPIQIAHTLAGFRFEAAEFTYPEHMAKETDDLITRTNAWAQEGGIIGKFTRPEIARALMEDIYRPLQTIQGVTPQQYVLDHTRGAMQKIARISHETITSPQNRRQRHVEDIYVLDPEKSGQYPQDADPETSLHLSVYRRFSDEPITAVLPEQTRNFYVQSRRRDHTLGEQVTIVARRNAGTLVMQEVASNGTILALAAIKPNGETYVTLSSDNVLEDRNPAIHGDENLPRTAVAVFNHLAGML